MLTQLVQGRRGRLVEPAGLRHHRRNLLLFGDQELLELTRAHRGIECERSLIRYRAVDLGRDRVEAPDALDRGGVRGGERLDEGPVGFGG